MDTSDDMHRDREIYLDWNSYGRLHPKCAERMRYSYTNNVNPQSKHSMGYRSRLLLEEMTQKFLYKIDAHGKKIVFTASATESNSHVLSMFEHRFVSDIEHPSIRNFKNVHVIPVDQNGVLDLNYLDNQIKILRKPFIVSYMLANHETGLVNDLKPVVDLVKKNSGFIHTDAVQAVGRIQFSFNKLNVDYMTLATHKCGGPAGIGALVYNPHAPMNHFYRKNC